MNINDYYVLENEKPLDNILTDGGFCSIFRTIACIGDSLSSGEFETVDKEGTHHYYDLFEHSWGQYIARMSGNTVYNFSRGGMTAKEYIEGFGDGINAWAIQKASQAYIIALGVNDLCNQKQNVGTVEDANKIECDTFAYYYGQIIKKYKKIVPDAKFFLLTLPYEDNEEKSRTDHRKLMYDFAKNFDNTYVIDLYKYGPTYDEKFKKHFFFNGHLSPTGYVLTAKMVASYIDYIIRKNPADFKTAGLIGTQIDKGIIQD